jgi:hypothetical protein
MQVEVEAPNAPLRYQELPNSVGHSICNLTLKMPFSTPRSAGTKLSPNRPRKAEHPRNTYNYSTSPCPLSHKGAIIRPIQHMIIRSGSIFLFQQAWVIDYSDL